MNKIDFAEVAVAEIVERRLVAIMAADVVGYSRLMAGDEEGTLARLKTIRDEIFDPMIEGHRGRIVKLMGDGALAEFASVVDALSSAVRIQEAIVAFNADLPHQTQILFRIGINIGDVIVDGNDIYGDGVNIAARIESLAPPGGICVSRKVYDEVRSKTRLVFEDLGEQTVKNIPEAVHIYRVRREGADLESGSARAVPARSVNTRGRPIALAGAATILAIAMIGAFIWWSPWRERLEPASVEAMAYPLPDKTSVVVLPFANISNDPGQDYFAEGLAEDLMTDLAKISDLFVISRTTAFGYRGRAVPIRQIAEELGVRYVLEGSVRRVDDQLRVNAQLIDAITGGHVWAERYDRPAEKIFEVQDDITARIVDSLSLELTPAEQRNLAAAGTDVPEAYDAFLLGMRFIADQTLFDVDSIKKAKDAFERAIALDPDFAHAHAGLGWAYWTDFATFDRHNVSNGERAFELAKRSLEIEETALAHRILAKQYHSPGRETPMGKLLKEFDSALVELEKARSLEPNNPDVLADLAFTLAFAGKPEKALDQVKAAKRLNPYYPRWYVRPSGIASYLLQDFPGAISDFREWVESDPIPFDSGFWLAAAYAMNGDQEPAAEILARTTKGFHAISLMYFRTTFWKFKREEDLELVLEGLHLAGVPKLEDL